MKISARSVLALSFSLMALGDAAFAALPQPLKAASNAKSSSSGPADNALPDDQRLYKPIPLLKPSKSSAPRVPAGMTMRSSEIATFDPIESAFLALKRAGTELNEAEVGFRAMARECWEKGYTPVEQSAAGCSYTETVASCYEKAARACVRPAGDRWTKAKNAFSPASELLKYRILEYNKKLTDGH